MGILKKVARAAASSAAEAAKKKVNGGCPGSSNGRHNFKTKKVGEDLATWCHNKGCGRQSR